MNLLFFLEKMYMALSLFICIYSVVSVTHKILKLLIYIINIYINIYTYILISQILSRG